MRIVELFRPQPVLTDEQMQRGLRMMTFEGVASLAMFSVSTGGILAGFALALGANNLQIGVLASVPFITQLVQIPSIFLVERLKWRKAIALATWIPAQLIWILIALIPVFMGASNTVAITTLLILMAVRGVLAAVTNCSWNGWVRDLVPQAVLGRFYSRRLSLATIVASGFGLLAAFFVDYWNGRVPSEDAVFGYTVILLAGALTLGLASPAFMSQMPEPMVQPLPGPQPSLAKAIVTPIRDTNFRHLMVFLFFWGFALNLAVPFFAVYMLTRLGLSLGAVMGLSVLSQITNVVFLRVWGPFADKFGSKTVLSLSASLYILVILGWTFTTMPERYFLTIPLLVALHIFAGIASSGATLTVGTIGLKLAPQNQATSYMAGASLATSLGAGLGPLVGGMFADFFSKRALTIDFTWTDPSNIFKIAALNLTGYDFLFGIAFILGLITLDFLTTVREEGELGRELALEELLAQSWGGSRAVSSVPGLRFVSHFPYSYLRRVPGMDVVLGVTAYQVAYTMRAAISAAVHGLEATRYIGAQVSDAISSLLEAGEDVSEHGAELARHASRGVIHALGEVMEDVGDLAEESLKGVLKVLGNTQVDPLDVLWSTGYGAVQGGSEVGADLGQVATQAIKSAQEMAGQLGLTEEEAASQAALGSLEAAKEIGSEAIAQVVEALPPEIMAKVAEDAPPA